MSNASAIATVTATLRAICVEISKDAVPGAKITTERPDAREGSKDPAGLNLFLYRASVNSTFRNHDTPTRDSRGIMVQRPATGFDLDYLFTFYGPSADSQLLLGQTVAALHTEPILTPRRIAETIGVAKAANKDSPIANSDLAEQLERLRLTPIPLDLEELSKLWSVFLQVPYDLSIAYRVSVVLISADVAPRAALPVTGGRATSTGMPPWIEQMAIQIDDAQQPTHVSFRGKNLVGDMEVQFGDLPPVAAKTEIVTGEVKADLPQGLVAGITPVRVIRKIPMLVDAEEATSSTNSATATPGASSVKPPDIRRLPSNEVTLVVRPEIKSVVYDEPDDKLTLQLERVKPDQQGTLLLNRLLDANNPTMPGSDDASVEFRVKSSSSGTAGGQVELKSLVRGRTLSPPLNAPRHNLKPGKYLVRVKVDGGESTLAVDQDTGRFVSPSVTIP